MFAVPCDLWHRGKGSAGHWVWQGQATRACLSFLRRQAGRSSSGSILACSDSPRWFAERPW